jgi:hypothetical protein
VTFADISDASNWIDALKWVVPLVTSIVTAAIAVIVAIITYQQWRTNREKLRLDLYNRRFEIYLRCLDLYRAPVEEKSASERDAILSRFVSARLESRFLFPKDSGIQNLMIDFQRCATALSGWQGQKPTGNPIEGNQIEVWKNLMDQSATSINELTDKMEPFLKFHDL